MAPLSSSLNNNRKEEGGEIGFNEYKMKLARI
jgi:hypothetical protein